MESLIYIQFGSVDGVHWPRHKITNVFENFCFVTFSQVSYSMGDTFAQYCSPVIFLQLILMKYVLNAISPIHLHLGGDWKVVS